jgi:hypothetical protein
MGKEGEIAHAITLQQHPDLRLSRLTDGQSLTESRTPEDVTVDLLAACAITPGQAIEVLQLMPKERVAVAKVVADQNRNAQRPVSERAMRQLVREWQRGPVQGLHSTPVRAPVDLWMSGQGDYPSAVTIAAHIHDLAAWLEALMESLEHPHPDLVALYRALRLPALQHQVDALIETAQQLLRHHITDA